MLLGEWLDGNPAQLERAWRDGGFTHLFDFPLAFAANQVFCEDASPMRLGAVLSNDRRYPDPSRLVTLLDNHDLPRVMSLCKSDLGRVRDAWAFLLTARGVPSITWGSEVGAEGDSEPANRASMQFDESHPLFTHLSKLLALRRQSPALRDGASVVLAASPAQLVIGRASPDELAVVVVGGNTQQRPTLPRAWPTELTRVELGSTKVAVWTTGRHPRAYELLAAELDVQWRRGAQRRPVTLEGAEGTFIAGSLPELSDWSATNARALPLTIELPAGTVYAFKRLRRVNGEAVWSEGPDTLAFVE